MASHAQAGQAEAGPEDERTPLLRDTNKPHNNGAAVGNTGDGATDETEDANSGELGEEVATLRRRRWISLIASIFLIVLFVVILILSGGTCCRRRLERELHVTLERLPHSSNSISPPLPFCPSSFISAKQLMPLV